MVQSPRTITWWVEPEIDLTCIRAVNEKKMHLLDLNKVLTVIWLDATLEQVVWTRYS